MNNIFQLLNLIETVNFKPPATLYEDSINADKFSEIADVYISEGPFKISGHFDNNLDQLVFCCTQNVLDFFNLIRKTQKRIVLITHNSDICITDSLYEKKPENIVIWFSQNVATSKDDLFPLPIGLERPNVNPGSRDTSIIAKMATQKKMVTAWAYMSHRNSTNAKVRRPLMWLYRWRPYVTFRRKKEPFTHYIQNLYKHRFVFSPIGNGIDCHRTWEALYLGTIPIVQDGPWRKGFEDLPMLAVDSLTKISFTKLIKAWNYRDIIENGYFDKLSFSFWRDKIYSYCFKHLRNWSPKKITAVSTSSG